MAILTPGVAGPELAGDDAAAAGKASQRLFNLPHGKSPARCGIRAEEGDVRPRPAEQERRKRLGDLLEERIGKTDRQRHAPRAALPPGGLGGAPPLPSRGPAPRGAALPRPP